MQSETKTPPVSAFNMGQLTGLQKRIDQFLDEIYTAFKTFEDDLPTMIRGIFPRHFESGNDPQSQKWTDKEQEDLGFLKSFTDSLPSWDQSLNSVLKNPSEKIEGKLQSTLADFEDSNSIALTLQVGIEKINSDHRSLLHSRFSKSPNFLVEVPLDIEKRWVQRLEYLAALRKLHEEVQKELSLSPLNESTLSLPVLLACVEIGELLIRKNRTPRDSWKCDDREIHSLLKLIPKLLHFLPEEKFQIGRFKLMEKIGEGGYGIVYKGYDEKLRREVAVKMPRISSEGNPEGKQIAIREARAAARLDHPGILPLLDIIDMPNQAILVSPYIRGTSLSNWLRNKTSPVSEKVAALWVLEITRAMMHAHSRGVLHCDLKPGNILLEIPADDCPEENIVPRIADFGLAKLVISENTTVSGSGVGLGTPMYMAPEQTTGRESLSVACDIYGVGGILYQLLANHSPFPASTMGELLREVLEKNPTPLKTYRNNLHQDLDAICMKCMEKKPSLRYLTMNDLNADLERFIQGEPTIARPLGKVTLALRWCRKHALLVSLLGIIFISLAVSTIVFMFLLQKVTNQARDNLIQKELSDNAAKRYLRDRMLSDRQLYASEMRSIQNAYRDGEFSKVIDRLNGLTPLDMGGEELRGFEWHYWNRLCSQPHQKKAEFKDYAIRYSVGGNNLAAISLKNSDAISVVDLNTGREIKSIPNAHEPTHSKSGSILAFAKSNNEVQWVDANTFKALGFVKIEGKINRLLFLDEKRLLILQQLTWKVLDISSGEIFWEKPGEKKIYHLNLCKMGSDRFVTWDNEGRIQIWDAAQRKKLDDFSCEGRLCQICESSNDGKKIAWTAYPTKMVVRDIENKTNLISKELKDAFAFAMAWSPDDKQIAVGGGDQTIDIYDSETGKRLERKAGHSLRNIRQLNWSAGGKLSSMGCQLAPEKSELLFWDENRASSYRVIHKLEKSALGFVLDSTKKLALIYEESNEISLVDIPEGRLNKRVKLPDFSIISIAHPIDPCFLIILDNREIWRVDHQGNTTKLPIKLPSSPSGTFIISPNGESIAVGLNISKAEGVDTCTVNLYNMESGRLIGTYQGESTPFNTLINDPKSDSIIAIQRTGAMVAFKWSDGTLSKPYIKAPTGITLGTMNSEFNLISVVQGFRNLRVMNFPTMTDSRDFRDFEANPLRGLKWTQDSSRLIGWGVDGTIRFWDGTTGQEMLKLNAHEGEVMNITELSGGNKILSLGKDNLLKLWDATPVN